ncbi:hypothetical protein F5Y05DRAFT_364910 [Hypoxylon sp. FL0543]|nr:hypothetical protein F5Y05DRAFT_364910 [Hypoxylon sp. FL0543]
MPPYNNRRQPQNARLWRRSTEMDQRSNLHSRGNLGYNYGEGDYSSGGLRKRLVVTRGRDGANGGSGKHGDDDDGDRDGGRVVHEFDNGPDNGGNFNHFVKPGHGPEDFSDDDSENDDDGIDSDGDDSDDDDDHLPKGIRPSITTTSSLKPIATLTTPVQSQATTQPQTTVTSQSMQLSTTLVIPDLTTPSQILNPVVSPPTTGRKEEGGTDTIQSPSPTMDTQSIPTSASAPTTTAMTSSIGKPQFDMDGDGNNDGGKHKWHGIKNPSRGGLDPTAEHLLIAAGAIGAFILFCFVGWIVYRVLKRTKGQGVAVHGGKGFLHKFNWRRRGPAEGNWDNQTMYMANEAPPLYEKGEYGTTQSGPFYGPTKTYPQGPGSIVRSAPSDSEKGTLRQLPASNPALTGMISQYPPGNESGTLRSQTLQPYYNESDLPRQPPDGYTQPQRMGNRASVLSSISSGFGDGDIIIPPPLAADNPMPGNSPDDRADNRAVRESWMAREDGRRETVYTMTSEDRPARFRSITSWVNQQAGRARRAGSRARERGEIPVMPAIPGEISTIRQTAYR